eukprot:tig00020554_g10800.t1
MMRAGSTSSKTPKIPATDRRIPKNPKYEGVRAKVDSGMTIDKLREQESSANKSRKDEIFKRIKVSTLGSLIDAETEEESVYSLVDTEGGPSSTTKTSTHDATSTGQSSGQYNKKYLLLDVRDKDEYDKCHIRTAMSHPAAKLNQINAFTADMIRYKNQKERIMVIYDDDEKIAAAAATMLAERGFENLYMLTGGLFKFGEKSPDLLVGDLPSRPPPSRSSIGTSASMRSTITTRL